MSGSEIINFPRLNLKDEEPSIILTIEIWARPPATEWDTNLSVRSDSGLTEEQVTIIVGQMAARLARKMVHQAMESGLRFPLRCGACGFTTNLKREEAVVCQSCGTEGYMVADL